MPKKLSVIHTADGAQLWPDTEDARARRPLDRLRRIIIRFIDERTSAQIIERLRELEAADPTLPITLIFDSRGGYIEQADAIIAEIRRISKKCPVRAVACGWARSTAVSILVACDARHRYAANGATMFPHFSSVAQTLTATTRASMFKAARATIRWLWKLERRDRRWIAERTGLKVSDVVWLCQQGEFKDRRLDPYMMEGFGFVSAVLDDFHPLEPHPALDAWR